MTGMLTNSIDDCWIPGNGFIWTCDSGVLAWHGLDVSHGIDVDADSKVSSAFAANQDPGGGGGLSDPTYGTPCATITQHP